MDNPSIISHTQGNRRNLLKYRKQLVWMLGTVVFSFFICLLPFRALTLWIIIGSNESLSQLGIERYYCLLYFCRIMHYINSAINPIFYNLMSSKFREGFLKLIRCKSMVRNVKWSDGIRKGTFNTTSTNLSSSNQQSIRRNSFDNQRSTQSFKITHKQIVKQFSEVSLEHNVIQSNPENLNSSLFVPTTSIREEYENHCDKASEEMLLKGVPYGLKCDKINNKASEVTTFE